MNLKSTVALALLAIAGAASGNLHLASYGLLQLHPSFTGPDITLYPGHHPNHDMDDHVHVEPQLNHLLYYSQEGHRPAMHGAKHGSLKAKFVRPTVVLDHTSHLKTVDCSKPNQIVVCFSNQEAFDTARRSWNATDLTIVTFHVGCGDELSGKRSYFNTVGHATMNEQTRCIVVGTEEVSHDDALESGEIRWGTYEDPEYKKRMPALGHVRMADPDEPEDPPPPEEGEENGNEPPASETNSSDDPNESIPTDDSSSEPGSDGDTDEQSDIPSGAGEDPIDDADNDRWTQVLIDAFNNFTHESSPTDDLNNNATALEHLFPYLEFDDSDTTAEAPADEDLQTIYSDGTVPTDESPDDNPNGGDPDFDDNSDENTASADASDEPASRRRSAPRRSAQVRRRPQRNEVLSARTDLSTHLEERFLDAIFNAIKSFIQSIASFFQTFVKVVAVVALIIKEVAVISGKLVAAAFGVPFRHSYHNDFKFDYSPDVNVNNKPPAIFGEDKGVELAGSGALYNIQCAKCGIHADFSVDGVLAFSIKNGVTEGSVSLVNRDPFTIDAQIGIEVDIQAEKGVQSKKKAKKVSLLKKQLGSLPLSPLSIPGIIILGPEISISAELEMTLAGQAQLLVGGSLNIEPGRAVLDVVDKAKNGVTGLKATFTPVAQLNGTITASLQLGLPIAIEVGLDILNGKWKKSVGLVDKPGVYASASVSNNKDRACDGVEIRLGVRNQIYLSVFDIYEYPIRTDTIYEQGLGCITSKGFDRNKVAPATAFNEVIEGTGGQDKIEDSQPKFTNVSTSLKPKSSKAGYRIIVDEGQTSILVAGKDGGIYLVESSKAYDLSAPWGTLDLESDTFNIDVFGRIMTAWTYGAHAGVASLDVFSSKKMYRDVTVSSLSIIKEDKPDGYQVYAIMVGDEENKKKGTLLVRYPTFCKTPTGSRLFATKWIMNDKGKWIDNKKEAVQMYDVMKGFARFLKQKYQVENPYTDCRTVRLTSKPSGPKS